MHKLIAVVDHLAFDCVTGTAAVESADTGVVVFFTTRCQICLLR